MSPEVQAENLRGIEYFNKRIPVNVEVDLPHNLKLEVLYAHKASCKSIDDKQYVVLVLPGGGYEFCSYREGRVIAQAFAQLGFHAAVLNYNVKTIEQVDADKQGLGLQPLIETAYAIDELRHNKELELTEAKVIVCGFSAGGHLAASICTRYQEKALLEANAWRGSLRPDGAILCYPVISATPNLTHEGSFYCLTGTKDHAAWEHASCEYLVNEQTPPAYIWHTAPDTTVAVGNALAYAQEMWKHGCVAELQVYPCGEHGTSLGIDGVEPCGHFSQTDPYRTSWLERAVKFVRTFVQERFSKQVIKQESK